MRIKAVAQLAAITAVWVGATAATAPTELVQGTPHAAAVSVDLAHEDTSDTACWVEKTESVATAEVICGDRGLRPNGSVDLGTVFGPGCGWTAIMNSDGPSIEPVSCN